VSQAAEQYFVCDRTIRNWIKVGKLKAVLIEDPEAKKREQFFRKWKVYIPSGLVT